MHIVTLTERGVTKLRESLPHIEAGRYLVTDDNVGELFVQKWANKAEYQSLFEPPNSPITADTRAVVLIPAGGHGDQLFLTPSLLEIHRQFPTVRVIVCVFREYFPCLESPGLEFVERMPYPPKVEDVIHEYDDCSVFVNRTFTLEHCIQPGTDAVLAMSERLRVEPKDRKPYYRTTEEEAFAATYRFPKTNRKRVGIQIKATSAARSWGQEHLQKFVGMCSAAGYETALFGAPGEVRGQLPSYCLNLTDQDPPLSFRESAAVVQTVDVMVAPDSSLLHIAGCLDVPALGLYGPFPASERVSHFPSVKPLQGHGGCPLACCHHHRIAGQEFPDSCPGEAKGQCTEMAALKPEYVFQKMRQLLHP